jgi:LemA protein
LTVTAFDFYGQIGNLTLKKFNMKRLLVFVSGLLLTLSFSSCGYNTLVDKEENVKGKWAQVENAYQRRADLIPNLVNTVKGAANFEQETLTQVIEARAKATSVTVDPTNLTPEAIQEFQLVSVERYPELKANQNFLDLQVQLEGTENRISTERRAFNEATQDYNATVRRFPNNIMAGIFGFNQKGYFTAEAGADKAPEVQF